MVARRAPKVYARQPGAAALGLRAETRDLVIVGRNRGFWNAYPLLRGPGRDIRVSARKPVASRPALWLYAREGVHLGLGHGKIFRLDPLAGASLD